MTEPQRVKKIAAERLEQARGDLVALSNAIHANAEPAFNEHRSAARVAEVVRAAGFETTVGVHGLSTAVEAVAGQGELVVTVCAEYDALLGIGHGCGHNIVAAAGVGAAIGLAAVADELGVQVRLLGTPAEEHGGGKILLLEAGAWETCALSLMAHPVAGADHSAADVRSQAVHRLRVTYTGRAAHAGSAPEQGINAADATTVALVAIGLLRQQLPADQRVVAIVAHGGDVADIIPARAALDVELRASTLDDVGALEAKVLACIDAGAMATGCRVATEETAPAYAELRQNAVLAALWDENMRSLGRELSPEPIAPGGTTDMGNVSHVVPSLHPMIGITGTVATLRTTEFAVVAASPAAEQAIFDAAAAMIGTVIDAALDPDHRAEFLRCRAGRVAGATMHGVEI